ncbi:NAD(P)H-dependent oxidoreductase [Candidatus Peribacteria bacterium]|nr:NAD(P)H-dependent oxidoreductase [Candidatus Peribacteria bacterium]
MTALPPLDDTAVEASTTPLDEAALHTPLHEKHENSTSEVLILTCHSDPKSLCYKNASLLRARAEYLGYSVTQVEAMDFPVLRLRGEGVNTDAFDDMAERLTRVRHLVLCYPMWNYSAPAMVKNWLDATLRAEQHFYFNSHGVPVGLIPHLRVHLIHTTGGPRWYYRLFSSNNLSRKLIQRIFRMCGVPRRQVHERLLGSMARLEGQSLERHLQQWFGELSVYQFDQN